MSTDPRTILQGEDAIALWKEGKEAWNEWVDKHPEADVDFSGVDFGPYHDDPDCHVPPHEWPFAEFRFPKGKVSFFDAQFGEEEVSFSHAQFGEGEISFEKAQFGEGGVDLSYVQFEGDVFFGGQLGREVAELTCESPVDEPLSQLNGAQFGEGDVLFRYARVKGNFYLTGVTLGAGKYNFEGCDFEQRAIFASLQNVKQVESFSFRFASFEKPFILSTANNEPLGCVVDLTDTLIHSHVSLQDLKVEPKEITQADIGRFCRLKELAENNKDHERALEFKAQEIPGHTSISE